MISVQKKFIKLAVVTVGIGLSLWRLLVLSKHLAIIPNFMPIGTSATYLWETTLQLLTIWLAVILLIRSSSHE